ncbi:MAG: YcxB family protein [Lachnospiraceae bacterium]|nr:YcxB family protein [Lachnospiraceae bacterium]
MEENLKNEATKDIIFDVTIKPGDMAHFQLNHYYTGMSCVIGFILSFGALALCLIRWNHLELMQKAVLFLIAFLFLVFQPVSLISKGRNQVKFNPSFKEAFHYKMNSNGITVSMLEESEEVKWEDIYKIRESKKCFFLYFSRVQANIIPKKQMTTEQCVEVKKLIVEQLPAKKYRLNK